MLSQPSQAAYFDRLEDGRMNSYLAGPLSERRISLYKGGFASRGQASLPTRGRQGYFQGCELTMTPASFASATQCLG